jgi:hypothetical protein
MPKFPVDAPIRKVVKALEFYDIALHSRLMVMGSVSRNYGSSISRHIRFLGNGTM